MCQMRKKGDNMQYLSRKNEVILLTEENEKIDLAKAVSLRAMAL